MPDAFREIVQRQNATNAAILYDDSFGKWKSIRIKKSFKFKTIPKNSTLI